MALNTCTSCTTKFAVGLTRCPHCRSTEYVEDGDPMAKITRNGGVSDTTLPADDAAAEADPAPPAAADQTEAPASEQHENPGTGEPTHAVDGDEVTGDGSGRALPPIENEGSEEPPAPDYEAWTVEELKAQLDTRGLSKTGKKDDLVLRLLEDDDVRAGQAEGAPAEQSME